MASSRGKDLNKTLFTLGEPAESSGGKLNTHLRDFRLMANSRGKNLDKTLFTLDEVADITDTREKVLLSWESEFSVLNPWKLGPTLRLYHKQEVEMVIRIKELVVKDEYNIAGINKILLDEFRGAGSELNPFHEQLTILIADADEILRTAIKGYYESYGAVVITAVTGPEALKRIRKNKPTIVLLDSQLPVISGASLCKTLRADGRTRDIPIIFLSDKHDVIGTVLIEEIEANGYLKKPFDLLKLGTHILEVLHGGKVKQSAGRKESTPMSGGRKVIKRDPFRLAGSILGRKYELVDYVDAGGMGAVYRARVITYGGGTVAVKILKPDIAAKNPEYLKLLEKEVKNAQSLDHPHIVKVLDSGTDDGLDYNDLAYMVMEWIDGKSLEDVLAKEKLTARRVVKIFEQICSAVDAAHRSRIIHLDIKPANVLLLEDGKPDDFVKVIDFGLSRIISKESGTTVTRFRGTHQFCAPEQFGGKVSHRSDIYSLGATLYFLLTGVIPFGTSYIHAKLHPNLVLPDIPSLARQSGLPIQLDQVMSKALDKDPDIRYQSAMELFGAFSAAVSAAI